MAIFRARCHIFLAVGFVRHPVVLPRPCRLLASPLPALVNHTERRESVFAEWAVGERRRDGGIEIKGAQGGVEVVI